MAATRALLFLALAAGDPSPTVRPTIKATPRPVAAPTTPRPVAPPTTARPTVTPRPTVKATPRPVAAPTTVRPSAPPTTARPTVKATPRPVAPPTTIKPTPRPAATPRPTAKETIRPTPRPQQTPGPTLLPTAHFDGVHQTDATIRPAVKLWLEDNAAAVHKYGQIEDWDVSQVTDLSYLFCVRQKEMEGDKHYKHCVLPEYARDFDFDLSRWDTSRVTSMRGTFSFSQNFNQPIGSWQTSSVTDMDEMFSGKVSDQEATGFNQPIEHWDVSRVKTMERMFKDAAVCTRRPRFYTLRRRRRVSPPGEEAVGGLFFEFEAVRTARPARRSSTSPCRRGGRRRLLPCKRRSRTPCLLIRTLAIGTFLR